MPARRAPAPSVTPGVILAHFPARNCPPTGGGTRVRCVVLPQRSAIPRGAVRDRPEPTLLHGAAR